MYQCLRLLSLFSVALLSFSTVGAGVADLEQNPVTGYLESVGLTSAGVVHTVDPGPMGQKVMTVLDPSIGSDPRLSISAAGDTSVVWLDPTGSVFYRQRLLATTIWAPTLALSGIATASTVPAIATAGNGAWVAYETEVDGERTVALTEIIDNAEPFGQSTIAVVGGSQDLDLRVFQESGEVWVAWDDTTTQIAWSTLDPVSYVWSASQTLTYDPANKAGTYLVIRDLVVDP